MSEIEQTKIAGTTFDNDDSEISRQEIIRRCVRTGDLLELEREPNNISDPNAISIWIAPENDPWDEYRYQIGYLNKEKAAQIAPLMDAGQEVTCEVLNKTSGSDYGNGEKKTYGVNIELKIYTQEETIERKKQMDIWRQSISPQAKDSKIPNNQINKTRNYHISTRRIIIGTILLLLFLAGASAKEEAIDYFIFISVILLLPAILIFLPWLRWALDQSIKTIKSILSRRDRI